MIVRPHSTSTEHNKPPVANSGSDRTVQGPVEILALDGANSTDDEKIVSFKWKQTRSDINP